MAFIEENSGALADPGMRDLLDKLKADVMRATNCVQIGRIESFDALKNTASVSVGFKRRLSNGQEYEYPLLTDCPVVVLGGGTAHVSFPITTGDACLVFFCDRDIDVWHLSGQTAVPNTARTHSISDGVALVGIRPLTAPRTLSTTGAELNGGATKVRVKNAGGSLKTLLDSLIDNVNSLYTQVQLITVTPAALNAPTPVPNNAAAIGALQTQLGTIKTAFGLLLE